MEHRRYSQQREIIYNCLRGTTAHPTAEMIYQALKPENPKLSLGTVYRNLNQLADDGYIIRLPFRVERYDANTASHLHFCCEDCGRVLDLHATVPESDFDAMEQETGFHVQRENRVYYGICAECMGRGRIDTIPTDHYA